MKVQAPISGMDGRARRRMRKPRDQSSTLRTRSCSLSACWLPSISTISIASAHKKSATYTPTGTCLRNLMPFSFRSAQLMPKPILSLGHLAPKTSRKSSLVGLNGLVRHRGRLPLSRDRGATAAYRLASSLGGTKVRSALLRRDGMRGVPVRRRAGTPLDPSPRSFAHCSSRQGRYLLPQGEKGTQRAPLSHQPLDPTADCRLPTRRLFPLPLHRHLHCAGSLPVGTGRTTGHLRQVWRWRRHANGGGSCQPCQRPELLSQTGVAGRTARSNAGGAWQRVTIYTHRRNAMRRLPLLSMARSETRRGADEPHSTHSRQRRRGHSEPSTEARPRAFRALYPEPQIAA